VVRLVGEHAVFGAARPFLFLAPGFLYLRALGLHVAFLHPFDLVQQQSPRQESIHCLVPCRLAFHAQPRWPVLEHDARRTFVHFLTSGAARADKGLLDVGFAHSQRTHPLLELR
jgi:hypothetical protein